MHARITQKVEARDRIFLDLQPSDHFMRFQEPMTAGADGVHETRMIISKFYLILLRSEFAILFN